MVDGAYTAFNWPKYQSKSNQTTGGFGIPNLKLGGHGVQRAPTNRVYVTIAASFSTLTVCHLVCKLGLFAHHTRH